MLITHPGIEFVHRRCEVDCLCGAARRHGSGIEVDDHTLSGEVRARHVLAVRVRQSKGRRRVAIAEPSGHARTLALPRTALSRRRRPGNGWPAIRWGFGAPGRRSVPQKRAREATRVQQRFTARFTAHPYLPQIEADLGATRDRLAASVEALIDQVHPNRIKQRQIANVKRFANTELENAKSKVFNARGDLRTDRIAVLAARRGESVGFG